MVQMMLLASRSEEPQERSDSRVERLLETVERPVTSILG